MRKTAIANQQHLVLRLFGTNQRAMLALHFIYCATLILSITMVALTSTIVAATELNADLNADLNARNKDDATLTPYAVIPYQPSQAYFNLGRYIEMYEDSKHQTTLEDIVKGKASLEFTNPNQAIPFIGYTHSAIWVRFKVDANFPRNNPWYLKLAAPALRNVELFEPIINVHATKNASQQQSNESATPLSQPHQYKHHLSGLGYPLWSRNVIDSNIVFKIENLAPHQYYYLRIASDTNVVIPLRLLSQDAYNASRGSSTMIGFYYGGMVILIIYNLFFYLFNRSKDLLLYVAYLSCLFTYQFIVDGLALRFAWPNNPDLNQLQTPVMFAVIFFSIQFGRHFLHLRETWPVGDMFLRSLSYTAIILFGLSWFISSNVMNPLSTPMGLLVCMLLTVAGLSAWKKGFYPARFFATAWALLIIGSFLILGRNLHILPHTTLTQYGLHFGSLLEAVFLSFALADRINGVKREKDKLEKRAKDELESANKTLREHAIKLRVTMEELKKSNRLKDDFLMSVSHELRTPINGIQGSLNLLKGTRMEDQQVEYVTIAQNSATDLLGLVDSILELNSLNQDMITVREEELNLLELLDDCIKSIHPLCKGKQITIDMVNLTLPEIVYSDRERLQHIIMNILNNAVKFTEKGSISLSSLVHKHSDNVFDFELLIKDTGIGIAPENLKTVFDAFTQLDSGYTRKRGGIGIGLSICKMLLDKMQGKIFVASIPDIGTTFIIRLPLKVPPNVSIKRIHSNTNDVVELVPRSERNKSANESVSIVINDHVDVLIVEDIPVNQLLLKKALQQVGMTPHVVSNGKEAVESVKHNHFHIILMDCQMPVMNGFEATRQIRALEKMGASKSKRTPIIAVTANAMPGDREKCISAGMDDYIAKPYQLSRLHATIAKHLRLAASETRSICGFAVASVAIALLFSQQNYIGFC